MQYYALWRLHRLILLAHGESGEANWALILRHLGVLELSYILPAAWLRRLCIFWLLAWKVSFQGSRLHSIASWIYSWCIVSNEQLIIYFVSGSLIIWNKLATSFWVQGEVVIGQGAMALDWKRVDLD